MTIIATVTEQNTADNCDNNTFDYGERKYGYEPSSDL